MIFNHYHIMIHDNLLIKLIEKQKHFLIFHLSPLGNYFIRKIINTIFSKIYN